MDSHDYRALYNPNPRATAWHNNKPEQFFRKKRTELFVYRKSPTSRHQGDMVVDNGKMRSGRICPPTPTPLTVTRYTIEPNLSRQYTRPYVYPPPFHSPERRTPPTPSSTPPPPGPTTQHNFNGYILSKGSGINIQARPSHVQSFRGKPSTLGYAGSGPNEFYPRLSPHAFPKNRPLPLPQPLPQPPPPHSPHSPHGFP